MRTIRVAATAVALGLLITGTALAQTEDRPMTTTARTMDSGTTVTGKVTNVNMSGRSFSVDAPSGAMTFQTNSSTQIMTAMSGSAGSMSGSAATGTMTTLSTLKVGDQVRVAYSGSSTGTPTATKVEVMSAGSSTTGSMGTSTTGSTYGSTSTGRTDRLPSTASPLAAVLMTGLVLLMSGFALRRRRRG